VETNRSPDPARIALQLLALGALIATTFWIVRPFVVASAWATMIAVATWPLLLHAQAWLGYRRSLAVGLMTVALLLVLVVPLYFGITAIVRSADQIVGWSQSLATITIPPPPAWVETLPVVGSKVAATWQQLAAAGPEGLAARLAPHAQKLIFWFVGQVGGIGMLLLQFLLTVLIAAILYSKGETAAHGAALFARRLVGQQGEKALHLAAQAVRAVALGVVVTAIIQSTLVAIGLTIAGVPFATILTAGTFILAIAQVGAAPLLIAAVIWVYSSRGAAWGTGFLVWSILCGTIDNLMRPLLIKRGANLPLLLIFTGVIGGLIAFGVIGLFIGPVVLAVAYTLIVDWVSENGASDEYATPGSGTQPVEAREGAEKSIGQATSEGQ
jgi:predicted PurR-regulated permease PerM